MEKKLQHIASLTGTFHPPRHFSSAIPRSRTSKRFVVILTMLRPTALRVFNNFLTQFRFLYLSGH
jgi:hypothetical protein